MTILLRPIMTEKSMKLAAKKEYTFEVASDANSKQITKEVADKFKVDVLSVQIINLHGKKKMQKRVRKSYQTTGFKKAIIRIKKDQVITLFETAVKENEAVVTPPAGGAEGGPQITKEKKDILRRTNVKVERGVTEVAQTTQRKVITGK